MVRGAGTLLVLGASGVIGQSLLANVACSTHHRPSSRVVQLRRRCDTDIYDIAVQGDIDLSAPAALKPWLDAQTDAVIFLAGVSASYVKNDRVSSLAIHVQSFLELLDWALRRTSPPRIIYASSTAVRPQGGDLSPYAVQKQAAEKALLASNIAGGFALRFPTVIPRRNESESTSGFLNTALSCVLAKKPYIWPIDLERRIRLMSSKAAACHLLSALRAPVESTALTLDLPATVATPTDICNASQAPNHSRGMSINNEIDDLLARRDVDVSCEQAMKLGFVAGESITDFLRSISEDLARRVEGTSTELNPTNPCLDSNESERS